MRREGVLRRCACIGLAGLLIAACGGSDPIVKAPIRKHNFARRGRVTPRVANAGPISDGGQPDGPKQVIVMPPSSGRFVLLYPEELEAVRARIALRIATLEDGVLVPWPEDKMRALADRVSSGKLRENGPICARAPTLTEVVDAETNGGTDDELLVATPSLDCDDDEDACMVQVSIGALEGERDADLMLSAKVTMNKSSDGIEPWLTGIDTLAEVDELVGNGYLTGTGAPPPLVRAAFRQALGDFGSTFAASPSMPPQSALSTCHDPSPTHRETIGYSALLTVDATGRASKCAVLRDDPPRDAAQTKRDACVCQAAQKTKFPALPSIAKTPKNAGDGASRRVLYDVWDSPIPKKHPRNISVSARVNVLEGEGHPEAAEILDIPQLSDCFLETPPSEDLTFDLKLHLAATGKVEAVEVATVPSPMRACLTKAYLATPFVCDMEGQSRVLHAGVTLARSPAKGSSDEGATIPR